MERNRRLLYILVFCFMAAMALVILLSWMFSACAVAVLEVDW